MYGPKKISDVGYPGPLFSGEKGTFMMP